MDYTAQQLVYARVIVAEGIRQGVSKRGQIIGLATSLVECRLRMLANRADPETLNYPHEDLGDDSKSSGLFQQQPPWWGTVAERMDPTASARMFFAALRKLDYNGPRSAGWYAQQVQRSDYPERYDEHMGEASALHELLANTVEPTKEETAMAGWSGDPIWLAEVLRAEGLECDIFKDATADAFEIGHGDFGGIWGIVAHHMGASGTAGPRSIARHPTLGLASQLYLGRDGKFTLCGVGIAYHAGVGSWPGIQKNNANAVTIGIEAENNGTEGWTDVQYSAYVRGCGAILRRLGHQSDRVIGHKEWAAIQGKWDPGGIDMNAFRRATQLVIDKKTETPVPIVNEIDTAAAKVPWIGARVRPEEIEVGSDRKGRLAVYEHAHIYFYPGVGAFPIPHAAAELGPEKSGLFEAYAQYDYERGVLGYPVREFAPLESPTGTGAVQAFQGGVLYRKDGTDRGYIVHGEIGKRWAADGYEKGSLGWPISNETVDANGNRVQLFEAGSLYWHSSSVIKLTKG